MTQPKLKANGLAGALMLAALAIGMGGCGNPVRGKLEGRWLGDRVENFDQADVAAATGWAKGTSMEFAGSTITVAIPAEEPRSGTYEVDKVGEHQRDVKLAIHRRDGTVDHAHFKLDSDRSIRWMLGDGRAVVMRRED
jgi:hypothetical protein